MASMQSTLSALLVSAILLGVSRESAAGAGAAYPGYADEGACGLDDDSGAEAAVPAPLGVEKERGGGWRRIIDITHPYVPDQPAYAPGAVTGPVVRLTASMEDGEDANRSKLRMGCHRGTHVDAPGHFNQTNFAAGRDADSLDLNGVVR